MKTTKVRKGVFLRAAELVLAPEEYSEITNRCTVHSCCALDAAGATLYEREAYNELMRPQTKEEFEGAPVFWNNDATPARQRARATALLLAAEALGEQS